MKTLLALLLTVAFAMPALAQEKKVWVVHSAAAGGVIGTQNTVIQEELEKSGYRVEVVRTTSCKTAESWLKSNPEKPVVMVYHVEEQAYLNNFPKSDDACDIGFSREKLLTITTANYTTVCSMKPADEAIKQFFAGGHRVGVTYYAAVNQLLAKGILDSLKIQGRIVRFQGNPKLVQGLVGGDVDFTIQANAESAVKAGATCFLTTAPKDYAHKAKMNSLEEFDAKNPWISRGHVYTYIGMNLSNKKEITDIAVRTVNTNPIIQAQFKVNSYKAGLAAGMTEEQQWRKVDAHIKAYK